MKYYIMMSLMVVLTVMFVLPEAFAEVFYATKPGDTWTSVAGVYGVSESKLKSYNRKIKERKITVWKMVRIPPSQSVIALDAGDVKKTASSSLRVKKAVKKVALTQPKVGYDGPWDWKIAGADPFVGDRSLAFRQLELEPMEIIELEQLIASKKFSPEKIKSGDYFDIQI